MKNLKQLIRKLSKRSSILFRQKKSLTIRKCQKNFLTDRDDLPEKELLEKARTMTKVEYLPLGIELKAQTDISKKQQQRLGNTYEFDKIIKKEKPTFKKCNRSNLTYDSKYSFYLLHNIKDFNSFKVILTISKYPILFSFCSNLNKFNNLNP